MKKMKYFALMSAIALTSMVSLSACSSSEDAIDNPDYNPEDNTVKTEFAISLQENIAKTRMGGDNVQSSGTINKFLGMKNIKLIPFQTESAAAATATSAILTSTIISLADIPAANSGSATEANKVYTDVDVPVGTNRFILYGDAGQTAGFENGDLTVTGLSSNTATDVSGVTFTPVKINTDPTGLAGYRNCKNLLQLLNRVAASSVGEGTSEVTWRTGDKQTTNFAIASKYGIFSKITTGSSQNVQNVLGKLYKELKPISEDNNADGHELAAKIMENITGALSYTDGDNINCTANTYDATNQTLTLSDSYTGYPANINLPNGAARVKCENAVFTDASSSVIGSASTTSLDAYAYPANLQYFVNSDIKTATTKKLGSGISSWSTTASSYTENLTSVSGDTRSILLNKQIQYGVCRLDVNVNQLSSAEGVKYYDNVGNEVTITDNGFTLTGILVGNQTASNWSFNKGTNTTAYTVYDKKIAGGDTGSKVTKTSATATNYTLLLESGADDPINIALEFVNNGADFQGKDGVVHSGSTFYLVGTLTPSEGGSVYGTDDGKTNKVFTQDYTTTASFTIKTGEKSDTDHDWSGTPAGLGNALLGLPDLRTPQLELGLSVDLSWTPGLSFTVDL